MIPALEQSPLWVEMEPEKGEADAGSDRPRDADLRMLIKLSPEQERVAREKVSSFLASFKTHDEKQLAVEGRTLK